MPRVKQRKEVLSVPGMRFSQEDVRFGTPVLVAEYRAKRLACNALVEIGCGVGFQTAAFARTCKRVLAFEKDERKAADCAHNMRVLGLKNVEVVAGDALVFVGKIVEFSPEVIFCDTERAPAEEQRSLSTIRPDPRVVLEKCCAITENIAIEVPPHLKVVPEGSEQEFLSVSGLLNRLTVYFGGLKKAEVSAVFLPGEVCLVSHPVKKVQSPLSSPEWLYEIDAAVVRAGLVKEALEGTRAWPVRIGGREYALSKVRVVSLWLRSWRIMDVGEDPKKTLRRMGAGRVVIHGRIAPDEQTILKKKWESGLSGEKIVHIFVGEKEHYFVKQEDIKR